MSFLKRIFTSSSPAGNPASQAGPHSVPASTLTSKSPMSQENSSRRELLRLVLRDTLNRTGIPTSWLGVDLLVHEALAPQLVKILHDAAQAVDRPGLAKVLSDIPGYHTPPVQAAQIATAARVKQLLFYHVLPPLVAPGAEAAFMQGVRNAFNGAATLGRDGTMISLPAQSTSIQVRNLL